MMILRFFLICCLFSSCDIPGYLIVENELENNVNLSIHYLLPEGGMDTLDIAIPAKDRKGVIMGFGTKWDKRGMKYFSEITDKIVIETLSDTIVISDQLEILRFIEGGRTNFSRRKLFLELN